MATDKTIYFSYSMSSVIFTEPSYQLANLLSLQIRGFPSLFLKRFNFITIDCIQIVQIFHIGRLLISAIFQ